MCESGRVCYTAANGSDATVSYVRRGAGPPVVLVHGVGLRASIWEPQIEALSAHYDVVAMDMLGHGRSSLPPRDAHLVDYSEQILALLNGLGLDTAHLVGHSMGALASLEFATTYPTRLTSVAALSAVFCRTEDQRAAIAHRLLELEDGAPMEWSATIDRWFGDPVPPEWADAAQKVLRMLESTDPVGYKRTYRVFATADDAHRDRLGRLEVPALFVTGENDPNSLPEMSRQMARSARNGFADFVRDEKHMIGVTAASQVNDRLASFFRQSEECHVDRHVRRGGIGRQGRIV